MRHLVQLHASSQLQHRKEKQSARAKGRQCGWGWLAGAARRLQLLRQAQCLPLLQPQAVQLAKQPTCDLYCTQRCCSSAECLTASRRASSLRTYAWVPAWHTQTRAGSVGPLLFYIALAHSKPSAAAAGRWTATHSAAGRRPKTVASHPAYQPAQHQPCAAHLRPPPPAAPSLPSAAPRSAWPAPEPSPGPPAPAAVPAPSAASQRRSPPAARAPTAVPAGGKAGRQRRAEDVYTVRSLHRDAAGMCWCLSVGFTNRCGRAQPGHRKRQRRGCSLPAWKSRLMEAAAFLSCTSSLLPAAFDFCCLELK